MRKARHEEFNGITQATQPGNFLINKRRAMRSEIS
jgi:hypothetical protein